MEKRPDLTAMLVDHFIGEIPEDAVKPVSYAMCGDGMWEIRRNAVGTFFRHAAPMQIPGLPDGPGEGFELAVPKIPLQLLWQAIAFFREVFAVHKSEAAVRVAYSRKSGKYFLDCPPQEVSAARCHFDRLRVPADSVVVAEIHSHGDLTAQFSSIDDRDEIADRFYGVVGHVDDFFPQVTLRLSIGGNHMDVDVPELFDTERDPMGRATFPPGWLDQVKHKPFRPRGKKLPDADDGDPSMFLPGWDSVLGTLDEPGDEAWEEQGFEEEHKVWLEKRRRQR